MNNQHVDNLWMVTNLAGLISSGVASQHANGLAYDIAAWTFVSSAVGLKRSNQHFACQAAICAAPTAYKQDATTLTAHGAHGRL